MSHTKLTLTLRGKVNLVFTIPALLLIPVVLIMDVVVVIDYFIHTAFPYVVIYFVVFFAVDKTMAYRENLFERKDSEDA
jgi:hypothetical protein